MLPPTKACYVQNRYYCVSSSENVITRLIPRYRYLGIRFDKKSGYTREAVALDWIPPRRPTDLCGPMEALFIDDACMHDAHTGLI